VAPGRRQGCFSLRWQGRDGGAGREHCGRFCCFFTFMRTYMLEGEGEVCCFTVYDRDASAGGATNKLLYNTMKMRRNTLNMRKVHLK